MDSKRSVSLGARLCISSGVILALMALMAPPAGASTADRSRLKNFQHVFILMMENTGYDSLIGNPNAPWINFAASTYGLAKTYYGVTHPSQPNYIAATSGSTNGVPDDNDITINVPNIVDQLEAKGKTWRAYMQSLSLCVTKLDHACGNQLYERKHDPFVSYQDVQSNPARLVNIVDLGSSPATWRARTCRIMYGSAQTSATICMDAAARQATHVISAMYRA